MFAVESHASFTLPAKVRRALVEAQVSFMVAFVSAILIANHHTAAREAALTATGADLGVVSAPTSSLPTSNSPTLLWTAGSAGSSCVQTPLAIGAQAFRLCNPAFVHGLATAMVCSACVLATAYMSGAHGNPIFTLAAFVVQPATQRARFEHVLWYCLAQFGGALLGGLCAAAAHPRVLTALAAPAVPTIALIPNILLAEAVSAFVLTVGFLMSRNLIGYTQQATRVVNWMGAADVPEAPAVLARESLVRHAAGSSVRIAESQSTTVLTAYPSLNTVAEGSPFPSMHLPQELVLIIPCFLQGALVAAFPGGLSRVVYNPATALGLQLSSCFALQECSPLLFFWIYFVGAGVGCGVGAWLAVALRREAADQVGAVN